MKIYAFVTNTELEKSSSPASPSHPKGEGWGEGETTLCEAEHLKSVWLKHDECLSVATNLSGTNLDVEDARRVSDWDVANQFSSCSKLIEKRREPEGQAVGCFFVWFVYFGHTK